LQTKFDRLEVGNIEINSILPKNMTVFW